MQVEFLKTWSELEDSIGQIEEERARLEDTGPDLEMLKEINRFDVHAYDVCLDYGNEMLLKFTQAYKAAASGFNRFLDEKINYARRFVVRQNSAEINALEQKVREARRNAVVEARKAVKIKQQMEARIYDFIGSDLVVTADYVNSVEPTTHSYKVLGKILIDGYCWTDKLRQLKKKIGSMQRPDKYQDIKYLEHLSKGLDIAFKSGEMRGAASTSVKKRREIVETLQMFDEFIGLKQYAA